MTAFALLAALMGWPHWIAAALASLVCTLVLIDGVRLARRPRPVAQRHLPAIVPVNQGFVGRLQLHHRGPGCVRGELLEQSLPSISCELSQHRHTLAAKPVNIRVDYSAGRRGSVRWQWLQWTDESPLRLWRRRSLLPCETALAVYPNYAKSRRMLRLSLSKSLHELGVAPRRQAGDSQEFLQLRAYQQGDSPRQIDWKASSRRRQLISREYTEERNQSLVMMLDCGRRMRLRNGELELLDESLDAALMTAEVALRQGDKVSLQCFAAQPLFWSGANKTPRAISAMLAQLHDVASHREASDYVLAARSLRAVLRQRSTVIMVTHSRNESLEEIGRAVSILNDKHRVVVADINDGILTRLLAREPEDFDQALEYVGALEYQRDRQRAHRQLRHLGAEVIDVPPRQLVSALVGAYRRRRSMAA